MRCLRIDMQFHQFVKTRLLVCACAGLLTTIEALSAQQADGAGDQKLQRRPNHVTAAEALYHIGPGDVLELRVFGRPELTADAARVDAAGNIRLPLLKNSVHAACKTEAELATDIGQDYREYLVDPQVTLFVKEYSAEVVSVAGAVTRPGSFELKRPVTVRELLALAGGLGPTAGSTIQIARDPDRFSCSSETEPETGLMVLTRQALFRGDVNPLAAPGDFIYMTEATNAYVVGNVYKPSPVPLIEPVTLTRAIAIAGGRLGGSRDEVQLLRQTSENSGHLNTLTFSFKAIEKNKQEDPVLRAGDIVEVRTSLAKNIAKAVLPALANAASYSVTVVR